MSIETLWTEYNAISAQIDTLEKQRKKVLEKIQNPPSVKELKIAFGIMNGRKGTEMAEEYGVTKQYVSKVVAKCIPHIAHSLKAGQP